MKQVMDELLISVTCDIEQRAKLIPKLYGGGTENIVYMTSDKVLDTQLVRKIIENPDKNKVMFTPPIQPKAGEVYVFSTGGNLEKLNWRSDKYNILYGLTEVDKEFLKSQSHYGNYSIRYQCT